MLWTSEVRLLRRLCRRVLVDRQLTSAAATHLDYPRTFDFAYRGSSFVPISLLSRRSRYYLDDFQSNNVFRQGYRQAGMFRYLGLLTSVDLIHDAIFYY